nr:hypothetical protein [Bacteroidales bacterium]
CDFADMLDEQFDDITLPDEDLNIASTANLVDYIKWAMKMAPAEKYILVLSDHGGGYSPEDELPANSTSLSKGFIYDDGAQFDHFTAEKLISAIKQAGIRPEVIYMDACLMNTIEYQYELKDYANYLIMSTFSVPGPGGNYTSLVNELASNTNIETALTNFCNATIKRWDEVMDEESQSKAYPYSDISVINTAKMDNFGNLWKTFTEQLVEAYQSYDEAKDAIDQVTAQMMPMECAYALYDMNFYADQIIKAAPDYFDESLDQDLANAYESYIVCRRASKDLEKYGYKIGTSVLFGCNNHYTSYSWAEDEETGEQCQDGYVTYDADGTMLFFDADGTQYDKMTWNGTFDNTYKQLKFDQLTNWSSWIEVNEQESTAQSPSGLYYTISEDGFSPAE